MNRIEQVATAGLVARKPSPADFDDLCALYADPRVVATLGGKTLTADETRQSLDASIEHWNQHGFGVWTWRTVQGRLVGRGGLRRIEIEGRAEVEVLYAIAAEFWRLGYATEIAREAVRVAFDELGLESVIAVTLPTNTGSRRVMENAGLGYERDVTWAGLPHVLYRIRRADGGAGGAKARE